MCGIKKKDILLVLDISSIIIHILHVSPHCITRYFNARSFITAFGYDL